MSRYRGPRFKKIRRLGALPGLTNKRPKAGSDLRNRDSKKHRFDPDHNLCGLPKIINRKFSFTTKIRRLTSHLELHKKDFSSQRGLRKILGKRQRLLAYLSKRNRRRYKELIGELDIREIKTH